LNIDNCHAIVTDEAPLMIHPEMGHHKIVQCPVLSSRRKCPH